MTGDNHMHMDDELLREALEALKAAKAVGFRKWLLSARATITKLEERLLNE